MHRQSHALGIDFGTSNSAAGFMQDGHPRLIRLEHNQTTLPTTFFFDYDSRETLLGEPANKALLDGVEGRFMRALKRVLGTSLMHEKRQILNERVTFVDIIARFLREIKTRAEAETGLVFDRALSGRPVFFHGPNDPREAQAEADLHSCYLAAGFKFVAFMPEPAAAALAGASQSDGDVCLIVDVGGGTSDFSVFRTATTGAEILANHGVRLGGTDFDRVISFAQVMPLLGRGTMLRNAFGAGSLPAPNGIFHDLATWEKIPFLYNANQRRQVADMVRIADAPAKFERLFNVLNDELGHEIAFAVERAKIDANGGERDAQINLDVIETGLRAPLPSDVLAATLAPMAQALRDAALETVSLCALKPKQVDQVIYVGGSSLLGVVSDTMRAIFPDAQHRFSDVFTAVTDGLARASAQH